MRERFVFGIPLIARASARDWAVVDRLLGITLRSLLAQTDGDFEVLLAAHDRPSTWAAAAQDPRFRMIEADWPPEPPTPANDDGGRKKWLIKQAVRERGGGLLMFLDADDWVACDLVETARQVMQPDDVGAIVTQGFALDHASLRVAAFPLRGAFDGPFHGLCGSSTIGRIVAGSTVPHRIDPHAALGSHHEWEERSAREGLPVARLPCAGVYTVGTGQNHSETDGPFADWRSQVTEAVRSAGVPLTADLARRFGQDADTLRLDRGIADGA